MASVYRYFKSRFAQEEEIPEIHEFITFDKGNSVGYPSDVVTCDFNHDVNSLAIGTVHNDVIVYGGRGYTWRYCLNDVPDLNGVVHLVKLVYMSPYVLLALCRGGYIFKFQIEKDVMSYMGSINLDLGQQFRWKVTYVQKMNESQSFLVFALGDKLKKVDHMKLASGADELISASRWDKFMEKPSLQFTTYDITCITSFPQKPHMLIVVIGNGIVGVQIDSQLLDAFSMMASDQSHIKEVHWDPTGEYIYAIGVNNKITRWVIHSIMKGMSPREIEPVRYDQVGPYPCNTLRHFRTLTNFDAPESTSNFMIYEGGKNRANYDDRRTVSIRLGERIDNFEVSEEIVNIHAVQSKLSNGEINKKNGVVFIVTKTELLLIDLDEEGWLRMRPKYLFTINMSTPTCQTRTFDIDETAWNNIKTASDNFWAERKFGEREYPLTFLDNKVCDADIERPAYRQVHLTGHASGAIILWESGGMCMNVLLIIQTYAEFVGYNSSRSSSSAEIEDVSQRFVVRKIGDYDAYEDDANLAITQLHMDRKKGTIIAANRGGYIIVYDIYNTKTEMGALHPKMFSWEHPSKGSTNSLIARRLPITYAAGYQPMHEKDEKQGAVFQFCPNIDITAMAYIERFGCLSVGSDSGFFFVNVKKQQKIHYEAFHIQEGADYNYEKRPSRYKSLKKSLRKTFRRKKRADGSSANTSSDQGPSSVNSISIGADEKSCARLNVSRRIQQPSVVEEVKCVERLIAARKDLPDSLPTYIITSMNALRIPYTMKTLNDDIIAIGTSGGAVLFYKISERKTDYSFTFEVTKIDTLKLAHQQSVILVERAGDVDNHSSFGTRLAIITDEQVRLHYYPGKQKITNYKITSSEGLRIKRSAIVRLVSRRDPMSHDFFAMIVANDGSLRVHLLDHPMVYEQFDFIPRYDHAGQNSVILTGDGEVTHLRKWSEFQRFTVNAQERGWSNSHNFES